MAEEREAGSLKKEELNIEELEWVSGGARAYSYDEGMKCFHCGRIFPPGTEKCSKCGRTLVN